MIAGNRTSLTSASSSMDKSDSISPRISRPRKSTRPRKANPHYTHDTDPSMEVSEAKHAKKPSSSMAIENRPFDKLPDGRPFCCGICNSRYVCNPRNRGRGNQVKRSKHMPTPRTKINPDTGAEILLCNACGLTLNRPIKPPKVKVIIPESVKTSHFDEIKQYLAPIASQLNDTNVHKFYCPVYKLTPCDCIHTFISFDDGNHAIDRAHTLLLLYNTATTLSKEIVCLGHDIVRHELEPGCLILRLGHEPFLSHTLYCVSANNEKLGTTPLTEPIHFYLLMYNTATTLTENGNHAIDRTHTLLLLYNTATTLSKEKCYRQVVGKSRPHNVGLGNGKRRSQAFEDFVLEKRVYLRETCKLCERATQKILVYSNNFLHKKLKTDTTKCRVKRVKGKAALGQLPDFSELHTIKCCGDNCVLMVTTHRALLEEWRNRVCRGQFEARRVLGEMLTPTAGGRSNCYKFITWVTGCSHGTICRVNEQLRQTGGVREPPIHALTSPEKVTKYSPSSTVTDSMPTIASVLAIPSSARKVQLHRLQEKLNAQKKRLQKEQDAIDQRINVCNMLRGMDGVAESKQPPRTTITTQPPHLSTTQPPRTVSTYLPPRTTTLPTSSTRIVPRTTSTTTQPTTTQLPHSPIATTSTTTLATTNRILPNATPIYYILQPTDIAGKFKLFNEQSVTSDNLNPVEIQKQLSSGTHQQILTFHSDNSDHVETQKRLSSATQQQILTFHSDNLNTLRTQDQVTWATQQPILKLPSDVVKQKQLVTVTSQNNIPQQFVTLSSDNVNTQKQLFTLNSDSNTTQQQILTLSSDNVNTQNQILTLNSDSITTQQQISFNSDNVNTQKQIFTFNSDNTATQQPILSFHSDDRGTNNTQKQLVTLSSDNHTSQQQFVTLCTDDDHAQKQLVTFSSDNGNTQQQILSLRSDNIDTQQQILSLRSDNVNNTNWQKQFLTFSSDVNMEQKDSNSIIPVDANIQTYNIPEGHEMVVYVTEDVSNEHFMVL